MIQVFQLLKHYLAQINVRETLIKSSSKAQFKAIVRSRMKEKNRLEVLELIRPLKKVDYFTVKDKEYKLKDFFKTLTLAQARTQFLISTNMARAKINYMSDPVYSKELYLCDCEEGLICSTMHFKVCSKYEKHRQNIDWTDNVQVIQYYEKVLKLREIEEKNKPYC